MALINPAGFSRAQILLEQFSTLARTVLPILQSLTKAFIFRAGSFSSTSLQIFVFSAFSEGLRSTMFLEKRHLNNSGLPLHLGTQLQVKVPPHQLAQLYYESEFREL